MNKKIVLVTGASRGIGYELVKKLVKTSSFIVLFTVRSNLKGRTLMEEFSKYTSECKFFVLDLSNFKSISETVNKIIENYKKIDVLVNNAGVYLDSPDLDEFPSFLDVTPPILTKTLDINLFGPMILSQSLLPYFNKKGLIINISSGDGKLNTSRDRSGHIAYRLSKNALNIFGLTLSQQLSDKDIKILSVCPGWVSTDMGGPLAPRTAIDGASDIMSVMIESEQILSGSFLYQFSYQKY